MNAERKMQTALTALILDQPFFGSLALRLTITEDATCQTLWTDGHTLGYNPAFIDSLTFDETKGVLCHEVSHCAHAHHVRRQWRDERKWNIASDLTVNGMILGCGLVLPKTRLYDPTFDEFSTESAYDKLPDSPQGNEAKNDASQPSSGIGDDSGDESNESGDESDDSETNGQPDDSGDESNESGDESQGNTGDETGDSDPGGCGEVRDAKGTDGQPLSEADMSQEAQNWQIAVSQAAQQAKSMGSLPASLERFVDSLVNPKLDWRLILRRFVDESAKNDQSWLPPNKRFIHMGLYLPSCKSSELPNVVIACDTSGSIDQETLDQFASEISAILESYKASATVIYCDWDIAGIQEFSSEDLPISLQPKGGGGTSFAPVFDYVDTRETPACLIYLTDLEGTFPDQAPTYPVLWVNTGDSQTQAPFGETVSL